MSIPEEFLRKDKIRGIVRIHNIKDDKYFLLKSEDAVKSFKDERFKLDLGIHENKNLQKDYEETGLEVFVLEIDVEADKNDDLNKLLEIRTSYYTENNLKLY